MKIQLLSYLCIVSQYEYLEFVLEYYLSTITEYNFGYIAADQNYKSRSAPVELCLYVMK